MTLTGEQMLWISARMADGTFSDDFDYLAAVLTAMTVVVWMPEDDHNAKHGVFWYPEAITAAGERPTSGHRVRYVLVIRWVKWRALYHAPPPSAPEPAPVLRTAKRPLTDGGCAGCRFTRRHAGVCNG